MVESVSKHFFSKCPTLIRLLIQASLPELHGIAAPRHEEQCTVEDQGEASAVADCTRQLLQRSSYLAHL